MCLVKRLVIVQLFYYTQSELLVLILSLPPFSSQLFFFLPVVTYTPSPLITVLSYHPPPSSFSFAFFVFTCVSSHDTVPFLSYSSLFLSVVCSFSLSLSLRVFLSLSCLLFTSRNTLRYVCTTVSKKRGRERRKNKREVA